MNENLTEVLTELANRVKRFNVQSDEFFVTLEGIQEDMGLDNSDDLISFYGDSVILVYFGGVSLTNVVGKDFKFGFSELTYLFDSLDTYVAKNHLESEVKSQLRVSHFRGSLADMSDSELEQALVDDISLMRKALDLDVDLKESSEEVSKGLSDGVSEGDKAKLKQLKENARLRVSVKNTINDILAVYDKAFSGGYELDRYRGVFTVTSSGATCIKVANTEEARNYGQTPWTAFEVPSTAGMYLSKAIFDNLNVGFDNTSRQFNLDKIIDLDYPVFTPLKIVEFALGYAVDSVETRNHFSQIKRMVWVSKDDNYTQRGAIEKKLTETAWSYLSKVLDKENLWGEDGIFVNEGALRPAKAMTVETLGLIQGYLTKFFRSLSTFAVLKTQTGDIEDWASAEWVVSAPTECFVRKDMVTPDSEVYQITFNGSGNIQAPLETEIKGISVLMYSHTSNPKIADAEPLFAYKALESIQARGEVLSPTSLILGKALDGTLLLSQNSDLARIKLWQNLVHAINSGSRSGKGVMTSNAVATSVAAGRPVFPGDRKPDTGVAFYDMAGGSDENGTPYAYFIQGGQFSKGNIASSEKTANELDWDNNPKIMGRKERLVPSWWGISSYKGIWGDMAYYRHMILTLGILALRAETGDKAVKEALGGDGGILVIYDEITSYTQNFMNKYLTTGSDAWFNKDAWSPDKAKKLRLAQEGLKAEKVSPKNRIEYENTIKEFSRDKAKFGTYARDLFDNLNTTIGHLEDKKLASFKNRESLESDIYIIGQDLDITTPESKKMLTTDKGLIGAFKNKKDNPLLSFLYGFEADFILGFNGTAPKQGWRSIEGSDSNKYLTDTARRFAYFSGDVTYEDLRDGNEKSVNKARAVTSTDEGGAVYFKPYLILTNNEGEPIRQLEKVLGDKVDAIRANNSADGDPSRWNPKVGFEEYVKSMGTNANGGVSDLGESFKKARRIAEYVIHQMGYEGDYLDFLLDLRPEWNFSTLDIVNAFTLPDVYRKGDRYKNWKEYTSLLSGETEETTNEDVSEGDTVFGVADMSGVSNFGDDIPDMEDDLNETPDEIGLTGSTNSADVTDLTDEDFEWSHDGLQDFITSDIETTGTLDDDFETETLNVAVEPTTYSRVSKYNYQTEDDIKKANELKNELVTSNVPMAVEGILRIADTLGIPAGLLTDLYQGRVKRGLEGSQQPKFSRLERLNRQEQQQMQPNYTQAVFGDSGNKTESTQINGLNELTYFITQDIGENFGGGVSPMDCPNIEEITVVGNKIYFNGFAYNPPFPNLNVKGLPRDKREQIKDREYAYLFDITLLNLPNLSSLDITSKYMETRLLRQLGLSMDDSLATYFYKLPNLRTLTVDGITFTRSELGEDVKQMQYMERLDNRSKRRAQALKAQEQKGRMFRSTQWDTTKRYYQSETGWKRFAGVSKGLLGTGVGLAYQGGSRLGRTGNSILASARRLQENVRKARRDENIKRG